MNQFAILIPTYNEAISIATLLGQLREFRAASEFTFDVFVLDDNSPDRTADIVEELHFDWVSVIRRPGKAGLGAAYRAGFNTVLKNEKYSHVVTMDADGSHRVADLAAMFKAVTDG